MKKLLYYLLVISSCFFMSCSKDDLQTPSTNEFIGKWIEDYSGGPFYYLSDYITMDFNDRYTELSSEYYIYLQQGNFAKAQELWNEMEELKEESKNAFMGNATAVEITANAIKIGKASVYLNATSSQNLWASGNVWYLCDGSSGSAVYNYNFFKMSVFVENWETYHYTIKDGVLYFNDDKDCLFINGDYLTYEDWGDFKSMELLLQQLKKG